jgi:hypothetical protein
MRPEAAHLLKTHALVSGADAFKGAGGAGVKTGGKKGGKKGRNSKGNAGKGGDGDTAGDAAEAEVINQHW